MIAINSSQASSREIVKNPWPPHASSGFLKIASTQTTKPWPTREAEREDGVDAVAIVTPTDSHYKIAKKLLEAGLNVICDKPLCLSVVEARELQALAEKGELILCLTHNYSGYAMVRHAARMVRNGDARRDQDRSSGTRFRLGSEAAGKTRPHPGCLENGSGLAVARRVFSTIWEPTRISWRAL